MNDALPNAPRIPSLACTLVLLGCWTSHGPAVAEAGDTDLAIHIVNVRHDTAPLRLQVLGSEDAFNGSGEAVASFMVPASTDGVRLSLDSLPPGEYAIRVMQDLDGDGRLGANAVGMPNEPWGMSNDAVGRFGPPSWDDAKFNVPGTGVQTITLR